MQERVERGAKESEELEERRKARAQDLEHQEAEDVKAALRASIGDPPEEFRPELPEEERKAQWVASELAKEHSGASSSWEDSRSLQGGVAEVVVVVEEVVLERHFRVATTPTCLGGGRVVNLHDKS